MPSLTKVQSGFMKAQGALPLSSGTAAAPGLKFDDHAGSQQKTPLAKSRRGLFYYGVPYR